MRAKISNMLHAVLLVALVGSIGFGLSSASGQVEHGKAFAPDGLKWGAAPPMVPKGAQFAVLFGDPSKTGPFAIRLKLPGGFKIPAHNHSAFEAVTVISGDFNIGMGDKLDETKAQKLTPGSFIFLPEKMNHFAFATTESVVQINSEGPFTINYVNKDDDPRTSK